MLRRRPGPKLTAALSEWLHQVEPTHAFFAWLESAKLVFSYLLHRSAGWNWQSHRDAWLDAKKEENPHRRDAPHCCPRQDCRRTRRALSRETSSVHRNVGLTDDIGTVVIDPRQDDRAGFGCLEFESNVRVR